MRRATLGGLVLLLVVAADAGPSHATGSSSCNKLSGTDIALCQTLNDKILQPSFEKIDNSINKNGASIDNIKNSITELDKRLKETGNLISEKVENKVCKIDDNDKIIDQIKSAVGGRRDSVGLAVAGAGLAASLLTMLLMGIWVWYWRRSLDAQLRKRVGDDLMPRLQAIEDLLRKLDLESSPRASEDAANTKPPSAPPTVTDASPPPETRHDEDPATTNDPVADLVANYNKFLGPNPSNESINDFYDKYGMRRIDLEIKSTYDSLPSMIKKLNFYGYYIGTETIAVVPDIVMFDDLYIGTLKSISRGYGPDEHINKYFDIRWMAEPRLNAPLILGPSNEIIHRGVIQLRAK